MAAVASEENTVVDVANNAIAETATETKGEPVAAPPEESDTTISWEQDYIQHVLSQASTLEDSVPRALRKDVFTLAEEFSRAVHILAIKKRDADAARRRAVGGSMLSRRRATASSEMVVADIAKMNTYKTSERDENRTVQFLPPLREVMKWTAITMAGTLLYALLFGGLGLLLLFLIASQFASNSRFDESGRLRNLTDNAQGNSSDALIFQRNRQAVYSTAIGWAIPGGITYAAVTFAHRSARTSDISWRKYASQVALPQFTSQLIFVVVLVLLMEVGQGTIVFDGYIVSLLIVVSAISANTHGQYLSYFEYRADVVVAARDTAREALGSRKKKATRLRALMRAFSDTMPFLLCYAFALIYVFGILSIYRATETTGAKMAVYLAGLAIKVLGNKLQLHLIFKRGTIPFWVTDIAVFLYEYVTALLCRLMLLAIPDEQTALLLSVLNCVLELMVRTWCYLGYMGEYSATLKDLRDHPRRVSAQLELEPRHTPSQMTHKSEADFWKWGILRVCDGNNDMVIEYVTSLVAAGVLFWLPRTEVFLLTAETNASADLATLLRLVSYQAVPEVVVDAYSSALEIRGGLSAQYRHYWTSQKPVVVLSKALLAVSALAFCLSCAIVVK